MKTKLMRKLKLLRLGVEQNDVGHHLLRGEAPDRRQGPRPKRGRLLRSTRIRRTATNPATVGRKDESHGAVSERHDEQLLNIHGNLCTTLSVSVFSSCDSEETSSRYWGYG